MSLLLALILILIFIVLYILLIEIFTVLFRLTGLTREKAKFQVISLFTNAGFTTRESEIITSSPRRRKLAIATMVTGHIFSAVIISLVVSIFTTLATNGLDDTYSTPILISISIFFAIVIILKLPFVSKHLEKGIEKTAINSMKRKKTNVNIITELDNYGKFSIIEVIITKMPEPLVDKSLKESNLKVNYGINLLLVQRKEKVLDVSADTILQNGDVLVLFGPLQNIKDLFSIKLKKGEEEVLKEVSTKNEISIIDNYGTEAMVEIYIRTVPPILLDKTLFESKIKEDHQINVMMIKRNGKVIQVGKDTLVLPEDSIVVFGPYQKIKEIFLNNEVEYNEKLIEKVIE